MQFHFLHVITGNEFFLLLFVGKVIEMQIRFTERDTSRLKSSRIVHHLNTQTCFYDWISTLYSFIINSAQKQDKLWSIIWIYVFSYAKRNPRKIPLVLLKNSRNAEVLRCYFRSSRASCVDHISAVNSHFPAPSSTI